MPLIISITLPVALQTLTLYRHIMVAVLAVIALMTGFIAFGGHSWVQRQLEVAPDRVALAAQIGESLNEQRVAIGLEKLQRDVAVESWIEGLYDSGEFPDTEKILEKLSEKDPSLLSLSASVIQARNEEGCWKRR
ncbi:MAG: hypothetical protein AAGA58_10580 [Verrucomicrobiota bacterium]